MLDLMQRRTYGLRTVPSHFSRVATASHFYDTAEVVLPYIYVVGRDREMAKGGSK